VRFADGVASYRLVPERVSFVAAALVVFLEGFVAIGHASRELMPAAAYAGLALLSGLCLLTLVMLDRAQPRPCFCFDTSGRERVSWRGVVRLLLLIGCEATVMSDRAGPLRTLSDFWRAGNLVDLGTTAVFAAAIITSCRWILRLDEIVNACRAVQPVAWTAGAAESQFKEWDLET
jgi:hypothetical protein